MNIKIPYHKLGNLNNYSFVSFILDFKDETVFRYDFVKGVDDDFFSHKKEYITVDEEQYNKCDSIVFFPFIYSKNNWGPMFVMKKNSEFIQMNGGYEFLRNADANPDYDKVEKWLNAGKSIEISDESIGNKNLIYFTLFYNDEYIDLLKFLLKSLNNQKFKNFELLFITNNIMLEKLKNLKLLSSFNTNFYLMENVTNSVDASMQKIKIFEWEKIDQYKNILFLDLDILVINDISSVFENNKIKNNIFYGATHNHSQNLHRTAYHSLIDYSEEQLKNFSNKNISALNAGQFFIKNTKTMQKHFENINNFIKVWDGRYFFEQSFINYYFNLLEIADTQTLRDEFQFVSINENECEKTFGARSVFVHFMGNACNGIGKIEFIKKYYSKYL